MKNTTYLFLTAFLFCVTFTYAATFNVSNFSEFQSALTTAAGNGEDDTIIDGGSGQGYFGTGCIDSDPLFVNPASPAGADGIYATVDDGLQIQEGSSCKNSGLNSAIPAEFTTDIAGQDRIYDMGCYEFLPEPCLFIIYHLLFIIYYRNRKFEI